MKVLTVILLALTLGACSGSDAPAPAAPATGKVSEGNVLKADVDALAKAKQAEQVVLDAAEQQRKDVEANQ